jgi:hypothetical protein
MRLAIAAILFVAAGCSCMAAATPTVTDLVPIPLKSGVNRLPQLAPDGRDGLIVLGWRDNGNAHGYDLALVLLQDKAGAPFNVVKVEGAPGESRGSDVVTDDPHAGEDMVSSFRFARGRLDGRRATLLLVASRDPGASIPDPSRVTYAIYALVHEPDVGTTPDHFKLVAKDRSDRPYCNADMALSRRFNLPLRASYAGARTANGCP